MVVHLKVCIPVYTCTCDLSAENSCVYIPGGSPKNKELVYTPMSGSPNINDIFNTHLVGLYKLKV